MADERNDTIAKVDEIILKLQLAVAEKLLIKVGEGSDLRAAIDFLRLNRRSVTESDVIGSKKDASTYLDDLMKDLDDDSGEGSYRR